MNTKYSYMFHNEFKQIVRIVTIVVLFLTVISCNDKKGNSIPDYNDPSLSVEKRVSALLKEMTLEEKANMLSGKDFWHLEGIERLGIPPIQVTDCGHGVTIVLDSDGNWSGNASCFPTAVGQAATWNRDIIKELGSALGRETRATGSSILLAPMVNIKRTPLNGRNYETFSEDPLLSGEMAATFIEGVQSQSVGTVIKAITANNQQTDQQGLNVIIDKRTLNEIYLPSFRIAIKKANPWGMMTAYNGLNGSLSSDSEYLLKEVVKDKWNYPGFIVSDWRAVESTKSITAGLDLEMPGPGKYMIQDTVLKFIEQKKLDVDELDNRVSRILRALVLTKTLDKPTPILPKELNSDYHQELARKVSEEGIVLLKNENSLLPLKNIKKIAVIGPNASEARLGGGGSASVTPFYTVSPLEGLKKMYGDDAEITFEEGCGLSASLKVISDDFMTTSVDGKPVKGLKGEYFENKNLAGEPKLTVVDPTVDFSWGWAGPKPSVSKLEWSVRWTGELNPPTTGDYKIGFSLAQLGYRLYVDEKLIFDTWDAAKTDNFEAAFTADSKFAKIHLESGKKVSIRLEVFKTQNRNFVRLEWETPGSNSIERAKKAAADADVAIVFAGLSNFFEGGMNDRKNLQLPGDQNKLIDEVVKANPNTVVVLVNGSPLAMPWIDKVPSVLEAYYPGQEGGNAIARVLSGAVNPSGKLPETFPKRMEDTYISTALPDEDNKLVYNEGVFMGYRYYDSNKVEPLFPFGYGLSYTEFEYGDLQILAKGDNVEVSLKVRNIGKVGGAEVVQVYVHDIESKEPRPLKELKDFEKLFLEPNESKEFVFELTKEAFSYFSSTKNDWVLEPGEFEIMIGSSSRDIRLKGNIKL